MLLDNVPEFPMWLGAAALAGDVIVGVNPTRRGAELERDIRHADCQLIVSEARYLDLLDGLDLGAAAGRVLVVDDTDATLAPYRDAVLTERTIDKKGIYLLLFTSGTSGAPKACIISQGRLASMSGRFSEMMRFSPDDVMYQVMPLFHSNAIITSFAPWLASGATGVLRRKFSASGFLPDVRKYGVTYFNYVGKPLSYILATPERPDDADNTLTRVFGNEGADLDLERFSKRFGVPVSDGYGSTEGGANISRTPDMPKGALGVGPEGTVILDPVTGQECPRARFDDRGHLGNPDEAIGEIVNKQGASVFEGYYHNDEANATRVRDGYYWTGDLGYRDAQGFFYFAGRDFEWLRVDGENFAAAPLERILARHPDVVLAAVYAVPDEEVGDQVMCAVQLRPGTRVRPGWVRRVPLRAGGLGNEVVAPLRAGHADAAGHRDPEGPEAGAAPGALGGRGPGVLASPHRGGVAGHDRRRPAGAAGPLRGPPAPGPARAGLTARRVGAGGLGSLDMAEDLLRPLADRVAVVTGAGRGIGRAEALRLAAYGARVVVNDLGVATDGRATEDTPADAVVAEIVGAGGEAVADRGDVASTAGGEALVRRALDTWGRLDIVVNNAGFGRPRMVFNLEEHEWDDVIAVHLRGTFAVSAPACRWWRAEHQAGRGGAGRLVNTATGLLLYGGAGQSNYVAAKAGVLAFTEAVATEMAPYGVTANTIMPSARTRLAAIGWRIDRSAERSPDDFDPTDPTHVAELVSYLASPGAGWISGQCFQVRGGTIEHVRTWEVRDQVERHDRGWTAEDLASEIPRLFGAAAKRADPPPPAWRDEYHARGAVSTAPAD